MEADKKMIDVIPGDAIVEIKVSGGYYRMLQDVTRSFVVGKNETDLASAFEQIKSQNITEQWVQHYQTLLILCKEIEKQAEVQEKLQKVPFESLQDM